MSCNSKFCRHWFICGGLFHILRLLVDVDIIWYNCLKDAYYQEILWIDLFKQIDLFDSAIGRHKSLFVESIPKYYSKFALSNILCVTCYLLTLVVSRMKIIYYHEMVAIAYCYFLYIQMVVTNILVEKLLRTCSNFWY